MWKGCILREGFQRKISDCIYALAENAPIETILETVAYLLIRESPVKRDLPAVISDREDVLVRTVDRILYIDVGDVNSIPCFHLPISFVINTFTHDALKFLQLANIAIFPFR